MKSAITGAALAAGLLAITAPVRLVFPPTWIWTWRQFTSINCTLDYFVSKFLWPPLGDFNCFPVPDVEDYRQEPQRNQFLVVEFLLLIYSNQNRCKVILTLFQQFI